jgi:uncharacterized protein YndB with AHSA1/START domain
VDGGFTSQRESPTKLSKNVYTFTEHDGGTRATYVSTFESTAALQQLLDMGIVEGSSLAINQIDDLVAS